MKKAKAKKCKACGVLFTPFLSTQKACGVKCAITLGKEIEKKKERRTIAYRKDKLKTKSQLANEAQTVFNKWVRLRDKNLPCISCQRHHSGQYHAGHYLSRGAHPELRFNELNCHKQCSPCNNHLSGNIANYRINLINKIGLDLVEWLEGNHRPAKYSEDDLRAIKKEYQEKIKLINKKGLHP